ncbi:MAG TPA: glycosyl hydrolase family 28-related protein, partial [Labilithrix sp.]|nr:glycosyl hydrolase family 28-related protein [Labilithrix sp.]
MVRPGAQPGAAGASLPSSDGHGDGATPAPSGDGSVVAPSPYKSCPAGRWCSALYPPTWSASTPPDSEGRGLHDFSFAGYRYGEKPPASPPGAIYDVVAGYGADPTGGADATSSVQAAIAAASAAGGGVVFFPQGSYRVGGSLTVTTSGVVLRGTGTTSVLRFTQSGMGGSAGITFAGSVRRDGARALAADGRARANEVLLTDAAGLAPGDDVAIGWTITPSFVAEHGMTGTWTAFNGSYQPFFRSKVVSVDTTSSPHRVIVDVPLRYPARMRDGAALQKETGYVREVGVEHLGVTTAVTWAQAWAENQAHAIMLRDVADAWVSDVHSVAPAGASPSDFHLRSSGIYMETAKRVSVLGSSMENAQNRGAGGNGYLFEVSQTSEVLFADCTGRNGRHNFTQNWGFGNTGTVLLRFTSSGSAEMTSSGAVPTPSRAEHHHSLAMATLVDDSRFDDGFAMVNRGSMSSGAGHTATESAVWGASGSGKIVSQQFGWGYVIGPHSGLAVDTSVGSSGTAPQDFVEGLGQGETL